MSPTAAVLLFCIRVCRVNACIPEGPRGRARVSGNGGHRAPPAAAVRGEERRAGDTARRRGARVGGGEAG
uniref:Uncharacterized protein n=1 Tax=Arundo donax TaxID=35708 RepID=A0A0A9FI93_ARUDO